MSFVPDHDSNEIPHPPSPIAHHPCFDPLSPILNPSTSHDPDPRLPRILAPGFGMLLQLLAVLPESQNFDVNVVEEVCTHADDKEEACRLHFGE